MGSLNMPAPEILELMTYCSSDGLDRYAHLQALSASIHKVRKEMKALTKI